MIEYIQDGQKYLFDYQQTREHYLRICDYTDTQFKENILEILHLACFICYFKGASIEVLSDRGLIHELVHQLHLKDEPLNQPIYELRNQFQTICKLA
jgi:hypothetical protein